MLTRTALFVAATLLFSPSVRAEDLLPGRPDVAGSVDLADAVTSDLAGITVRPPAGGKLQRRGGGGDEVFRVFDETAGWDFVVSRIVLSEPMDLTTKDPEAARKDVNKVGFLETAAAQMPSDEPGKFLRNELVPIAGAEAAILTTRFSQQTGKRLMQQAIIRSSGKLFYIVRYTTPVEAGDIETDPLARRAVETFSACLDSVEFVDNDWLKNEQDERLFRTRTLMLNWTKASLTTALKGEYWLRLQRDGKDIGYSYVVEEPANDLPVTGDEKPADVKNPLGVRVGMRSRTIPDTADGLHVESESWMWVSFDRKSESFSNTVVATDKTGKQNYAIERGTALKQDRDVPQVVKIPGVPQEQIVTRRDESHTLEVFTIAKQGQLAPVKLPLQPFYLNATLGHLLPRILPLNEPQTYLFTTYVSENRKVMARYIDVETAMQVTLGGKTHTAVRIKDRIGWEGPPTFHYVTPAGEYLGSVNEQSQITLLVSDEATIKDIWKDASNSRPKGVDANKR
jgi:hypothetical protein